MVMYEAARAICNLPGVEMNDLSPAINVLQVRVFRGVCLTPNTAVYVTRDVVLSHSLE